MGGGKHLLLLAVFVLLERCHGQTAVSMLPGLKMVFSGDLFYLSCDNSAGESGVKWYFNNKEEKQTNKTWKFAVASPKHSGSYQCERNGQKSGDFNLDVMDFNPSASLTIKTGHPVMQYGHSVMLQLDNEDGLEGWVCWVYREGTKTKKIKFKLENRDHVVFQTTRLEVPETIFWCTDKSQNERSNQIIVRTSAQDISLEMYPFPAVVGETLTLKCIAWGTDQISKTVFYKGDTIIMHDAKSTYSITKVSESTQGPYRCDATYTHKARTSGPEYHRVSDIQDVFVKEPPIKAVLSEGNGLSCSCQRCPPNVSYHWYHKNDDQLWELTGSPSSNMTPQKRGTYACKAVLNNMRSALSNSYNFQTNNSNPIVIVICLFVVGLLAVVIALALYYQRKKRNNTSPIYEDVALSSRDTGDNRYDVLQKVPGAKREAEYDTLHPQPPGREKKGGEYEALKKEEMKEGVYHTLGAEGAARGEGGYEALKKEGMKEGVYHSLGAEGAARGEGGYEALKKEGMKEGVYHSLGAEGAAAGGEGGYEALKKEGMKEGVYNTLREGAGAGQEGEAIAENKDKDK
ncbi:uncharacterized protein LOC111650268 [Seriola lalandi dorsalis]|uniref:Uncharacterized LOC111650268 n=1 Tax=Seriola lalandi dorsalis TaxID=1841481 RepID=A0A3B4Y8Z2_SERLL|nr:uncharacterized protein LOC111650268 [Seriola lalandi dorsalis]